MTVSNEFIEDTDQDQSAGCQRENMTVVD